MPVDAVALPELEGNVNAQGPGGVAALSVVRRSASNIIPYLSYGANRLGGIGIVGVSLVICSVVVFLSTNLPLRQVVDTQASQLDAARAVAAGRRSGVAADTPAKQAGEFTKSLPTATDVPAIMASIVAVASTSGLELERGSYELVYGDDAISRYQMSLPVTGSYPEVRKFIEDVLATEPAVSLEKMRIERDAVSSQVIAADLKFSILLGGVQ